MLIGRHSFIRQSKLSDVTGRIDYISNPKRQEFQENEGELIKISDVGKTYTVDI